MRLRAFHHPSVISKINVTPLIDVVMVLIVFYLLVGRLASQRVARVTLPQTHVGEPGTQEGVVITVLAGKAPTDATTILVDGREITIDGLKAALEAKVPGLLTEGQQGAPVQLRADRALQYGEVAPVIAACKDAGLTNLRLISTREAGSFERGDPFLKQRSAK